MPANPLNLDDFGGELFDLRSVQAVRCEQIAEGLAALDLAAFDHETIEGNAVSARRCW